MLGFAFDEVGIQRLEARSAVANGRGNGALQKIGATREGVLRKSFLRDGEYHDQVIWSIAGTSGANGSRRRPSRRTDTKQPCERPKRARQENWRALFCSRARGSRVRGFAVAGSPVRRFAR